MSKLTLTPRVERPKTTGPTEMSETVCLPSSGNLQNVGVVRPRTPWCIPFHSTISAALPAWSSGRTPEGSWVAKRHRLGRHRRGRKGNRQAVLSGRRRLRSRRGRGTPRWGTGVGRQPVFGGQCCGPSPRRLPSGPSWGDQGRPYGKGPTALLLVRVRRHSYCLTCGGAGNRTRVRPGSFRSSTCVAALSLLGPGASCGTAPGGPVTVWLSARSRDRSDW